MTVSIVILELIAKFFFFEIIISLNYNKLEVKQMQLDETVTDVIYL